MDLDALLGLLFFVVFVVVPMISGARKRGKGTTGPQPQPGQGAQKPVGQGTAARGASQQQGAGRRSASGAPTSSSTTAGTSSATRQTDHPASTTLEEIRRRVQEAQERERSRDAGRRPGQATAQQPLSRGLVSSDPFEGRLVSAPGKTLTGEQYSPYDGSSTLSRPQGMGREGMSGEWPPPSNTPLAGGGYSSQLGREGTAAAAATGRSGTIGREGLAPTARSGLGSPIGREGIGSSPMPGRSSPLGREGARRRGKRRSGAEIGVGGAQPTALAGGARLGRAGLVSTDREGILAGLIWHEILGEPPSKKRLRRTRSRPQ